MKRALAERARGDDGGATTATPSPTKKFARFGGGEKPLWNGSSGTVVVGGTSTASTGSHISPCSSSSSHSLSTTTQVLIPSGSTSSGILVPAAPDTTGNADTGSANVEGVSVDTDEQQSIRPDQDTSPKDLETTSSEVLEASSVPSAEKISTPVVPTPKAVPVRSSSVDQRNSGTTRNSTSTSPGPRSTSRSSGASDEGAPSVSTNKRGRRPRPRPQPSSATRDKRTLHHNNDGGESDEEDENGASSRKFYLQFQNRALATELHRVKHDLKMLEEERTTRRKQCQVAQHVVEEINSYWTALEAAVASSCETESERETAEGTGLSRDGAEGKNGMKSVKLWPSTGDGADVETVPILLRSLTRLGRTSGPAVGRKRRRTDKDKTDDANEEISDQRGDHPESDSDDSFNYEEISSLLNPLQSRVENLSDLLSGLVRNHVTSSQTAQDSIDSATRQMKINRKESKSEVALLEGRIIALKEQNEEIANSRDHANLQERRIRRYLNRILAGQVPAEVLKDVEGIRDGDIDGCEVFMQNDGVCHGSPNKRKRRVCSTDSAESPSGTQTLPMSSANGNDGNIETVSSIDNAEDATVECESVEGSEDEDGGSPRKTKGLSKLRQRIKHLEGIADGRQERIDELMKERLALQNRINSLILPDESCDEGGDGSSDGKNSEGKRGRRRRRPTGDGSAADEVSYEEVKAQFKEATRLKALLEEEKTRLMDKLSAKLGDVEALRGGLDEQRSRFERRWKEVSDVVISDQSKNGYSCDASKPVPDSSSTGEAATSDPKDIKADLISSRGQNGSADHCMPDAKLVIVLQHKLQQALENARRIDAYRSALRESCSLVETLQQQSAELRSKYHAVVAQNKQSGSSSQSHRSSSRSVDPSSESSTSSRRTSHGDSSSSHTSSASLEKMQKDTRRLRKEIAALQQSRDSAKSKLERITNERDGLVRTNSRLLQQSSEKEEINAEALGTILHLKQQLSLRDEEKDALAQKLKSVQQLALASRLTATAKDRVGDEGKTALQEAEQKLEDAEKKHLSLLEEIRQKEGKVEEAKHQMVALAKDLQTVKARCGELAAESNNALDQRGKVVEELHAAKKQVMELRKKVASSHNVLHSDASGRSGLKGSGGGSHFTAEQLSTQLSVLKGRLACPVCNHRDKSCILLRCRHMFCRQCVDNNIKNRSRKCPACATRFDMKDVGEIWL